MLLIKNFVISLKVVGSRGVPKVAYDRYWTWTVVIDVRFSFYLAAILDLILFPFPLTPAQSLVIDLSISIGAAKCLPHHYFLKFFMFAAPLQCTLADLPTMWEIPPPPPPMRAIGSGWGRGNSQFLCIVVTGKMHQNCTHLTDYWCCKHCSTGLFEMLTLFLIWSMCFHH